MPLRERVRAMLRLDADGIDAPAMPGATLIV